MTNTRAMTAALILGASCCLPGCIAAAIPAVAGAAMGRTATDGKKPKVTVEQPTTHDLWANPVVASEEARPSMSQTMALPSRAFARFTDYALSREIEDSASLVPDDPGRLSAMLSNPSALDGKRMPCAGTSSVVLIDIDPAGQIFGPTASMQSAPQLSEGLRKLRARNIAVAWISGASAAYAGDVRVALKEAGLDPAGDDSLLMMRYPHDRKQTRREDLAASFCLLAIAGDTRRDFDELYDHLLNREAALSLERIIGDGWFLVPSLTADPVQTDTTPQVAQGTPTR